MKFMPLMLRPASISSGQRGLSPADARATIAAYLVAEQMHPNPTVATAVYDASRMIINDNDAIFKEAQEQHDSKIHANTSRIKEMTTRIDSERGRQFSLRERMVVLGNVEFGWIGKIDEYHNARLLVPRIPVQLTERAVIEGEHGTRYRGRAGDLYLVFDLLDTEIPKSRRITEEFCRQFKSSQTKRLKEDLAGSLARVDLLTAAISDCQSPAKQLEITAESDTYISEKSGVNLRQIGVIKTAFQDYSNLLNGVRSAEAKLVQIVPSMQKLDDQTAIWLAGLLS